MRTGWSVSSILLGLVLSSTAAHADKSFSIFPVPACHVTQDRQELARRVCDEVRTSGDGHIPWLSLVGTWVDEQRGVVIHFSTESFSNNTFGIARITISNLCTGEILAKGARLVTEEDLDSDLFEVTLRVYQGIRYSQLSVALQTNPGVSKNAARVVFKRLDLTKPKIVEEFWVYRP